MAPDSETPVRARREVPARQRRPSNSSREALARTPSEDPSKGTLPNGLHTSTFTPRYLSGHRGGPSPDYRHRTTGTS